MAVGDGVVTSAGGSTREVAATFEADRAFDLVVTDDRLVAVGLRGFGAWSIDGSTWCRSTIRHDRSLWNAVAWSGGRLVAVTALRDVAQREDVVVAAGEDSTILRRVGLSAGPVLP